MSDLMSLLAGDDGYYTFNEEGVPTWVSVHSPAGSGKFRSLHPLSSLSEYRQSQSGLMLPKVSQFQPDFTSILSKWTINLAPTYLGLGSFLGLPQVDVPARSPLPVEHREMPVVGFRSWKYDESYEIGVGKRVRLRSTGVTSEWAKGDLTATCGFHHDHVAPDENCHCGFYVVRDVAGVQLHNRMHNSSIVGAVMGWGKVVQHGDEGWRAQHVRVLALMDCKFSRRQYDNTYKAAKQFGLEIKTRPQLEALVREYGDPLPKESNG